MYKPPSKKTLMTRLCSHYVIILNWNGADNTLKCLESLYPLAQPKQLRLIVCDNASKDDSWARIQSWAEQHWPPENRGFYPQGSPTNASAQSFALIQTGANLGFAGGMNVGIRHALQQADCEYLWLLNNDITVHPNAFDALLACAQAQPQVALFGSTVAWADAPEQVQCAGGCRYFPLLTIFRNQLGGQALAQVLAQDPNIPLDYVYGAAMFLRASAARKTGLLNEEYFLFYEELDYAQRLRQAGFELAWCRDSLVYHQGSASIGQAGKADRERISRANYYENLSTLKYSRNFHRQQLWLIALLRFGLKALAVSARGDFYLLRPLWQAYRDFWRGR